MKKYLLLGVLLSTIHSAYSLPIDWHGSIGVDTTLIDNYRGVEQVNQGTITNGSQEVALASGNKANASFQNYVFRLNPVLIINDSATVKAEMTTNTNRGGRLGDSPARNTEGTYGNALYTQNFGNGSDVQFNQFYLMLYADTATYTIGRHSVHWGLGAMVNEGADAWDRFASTRDGITIDFKIGNFNIKPFFSRVSSNTTLSRTTRTKDFGLSLLYDNAERDLTFGFLYQKRSAGYAEGSFSTDLDGDTTSTGLGQTNVKLFDIYLAKTFGKFDFAVEVPLTSGELGHVYFANSVTKYKAKAILLEANYKKDQSWNFGVKAGQVSGDNGAQSSFDAMYLNPNYQVANILFRYNRRAFANANLNHLDSYITNAMYASLNASYAVNAWNWKAALVYAVADETATAGESAFNHEKNKSFTTATGVNQEDDLGLELDLGFDYMWNKEIKVSGDFGYLMTGDYYAFNNTSSPLTADDSLLFRLGVSAAF